MPQKPVKKHSWDFQWLQPLGKAGGSSASSANPSLGDQSTRESDSFPSAAVVLLSRALCAPALPPALLFSPQNQDKLYLPGIFTAGGSMGEQTLIIPVFLLF